MKLKTKSRYMYKLIILFTAAVVLLALITKKNYNNINRNVEEILCADKDDIGYIISSIYQNTDSTHFGMLTCRILDSTNNNLLSLQSMSSFIAYKGLSCIYKELLSRKLKQLEAWTLAPDSTWKCPISNKYFSAPRKTTPNSKNLAIYCLEDAINKCK